MYNSRTRSTLLPRSAARRASRFPHHPLVVQKIKNMPLFVCHLLAVYDFHFRSIPFQELRSFLTLTPDTALHIHSNHTLQHSAASGNPHFHFASSIHSVFPKPFSHAFPMVCFSFLRRVCPINRLKAERKVITPYRCVVVRSANIRATIRPHHPLVVQKTKTFRVDLSTCLRSVHSFKPITFQELRSFLTSNPSFHSAFISCTHLGTAQLR